MINITLRQIWWFDKYNIVHIRTDHVLWYLSGRFPFNANKKAWKNTILRGCSAVWMEWDWLLTGCWCGFLQVAVQMWLPFLFTGFWRWWVCCYGCYYTMVVLKMTRRRLYPSNSWHPFLELVRKQKLLTGWGGKRGDGEDGGGRGELTLEWFSPKLLSPTSTPTAPWTLPTTTTTSSNITMFSSDPTKTKQQVNKQTQMSRRKSNFEM